MYSQHHTQKNKDRKYNKRFKKQKENNYLDYNEECSYL